MELQKKDSQGKGLLTSLTAAITKTGINVALVDKMNLNIELRKFKETSGAPKYPALFNIPVKDRILAMSEKNFPETIKIIAVALTLCFESMNLVRKPNDSQVLDLAEAIVDVSHENDKIALEDLMLFLQKLQRGEYGELYESIDIPKFMSKFGKYRDERWNAALRIRDERELEYKSLGDQERTNQPNQLEQQMNNLVGRLEELKERLRDKTDQVNFLKGK